VAAHPTAAGKWLLSFPSPATPAVLTVVADGDTWGHTLAHIPAAAVVAVDTSAPDFVSKRTTNNQSCAWGPGGCIFVASSLVRARGPGLRALVPAGCRAPHVGPSVIHA
jgi:hypothetical protein